MTRKFCLILAVLALAFSSLACSINLNPLTVRGSGEVAREERTAAGFTRVTVTSGMQLFVEQGEEFSLQIEAEDNILPYIETGLSGDNLTIRYDTSTRRSFRTTYPVLIFVTMPKVDELHASGGSRIELNGLKGETLRVTVSGGGRAQLLALSLDRLEVDLSGGSRASLTGEVNRQEVSSSGGGNYAGEDLLSSEARIHLSGGGQGTIWVTDVLDAELSGGSQLSYFGQPQISQDASGGSSLRSRGDK